MGNTNGINDRYTLCTLHSFLPSFLLSSSKSQPCRLSFRLAHVLGARLRTLRPGIWSRTHLPNTSCMGVERPPGKNTKVLVRLTGPRRRKPWPCRGATRCLLGEGRAVQNLYSSLSHPRCSTKPRRRCALYRKERTSCCSSATCHRAIFFHNDTLFFASRANAKASYKKTHNTQQHQTRLDDQQRAVDFVAGAAHALYGHQEALSDNMFLFTPAETRVRSVSDWDSEDGLADREWS